MKEIACEFTTGSAASNTRKFNINDNEIVEACQSRSSSVPNMEQDIREKAELTTDKNLEVSTTLDVVPKTSAVEDNTTTIKNIIKSLKTAETIKRNPLPCLEVNAKRRKVNNLTPSHNLDVHSILRTNGGPSNAISQRHGRTSTTTYFSERQREARESLRMLQEYQDKMFACLIKEEEERLHRGPTPILTFGEDVLQILQNHHEMTVKEERVLHERNMELQGYINTMREIVETLQNAKQTPSGSKEDITVSNR